jgi:hypothetical protein
MMGVLLPPRTQRAEQERIVPTLGGETRRELRGDQQRRSKLQHVGGDSEQPPKRCSGWQLHQGVIQ